MTHHPIIRKRIAELQLELQAQTERDGQRYSMTRGRMVELLIEIITSPPKKATLDNPLSEVRYVGEEGKMVPRGRIPEQGGARWPNLAHCSPAARSMSRWIFELSSGAWAVPKSSVRVRLNAS